MGTLLRQVALAALAIAATAQRSPYTSPPATASATIGGEKIQIDYYAPSAHGRKVMGGLVPFDRVWCTGANWSTEITFDTSLQVGDLKLPKGSYSLWTLPGEKEWLLIVNKQAHVFHLNYDESADFGRTKMNVKILTSPVETFKIELTSSGGNKGTLALSWENTEVSVPITVLH